jgi:hypothetical protein
VLLAEVGKTMHATSDAVADCQTDCQHKKNGNEAHQSGCVGVIHGHVKAGCLAAHFVRFVSLVHVMQTLLRTCDTNTVIATRQ